MSDNRVNELFLFDILVAIIKIEIVSEKFRDGNALLNDFISWDSVIREFEVIGEATKILISEKLIHKKYQIVVDFRNKITHHYFGIDAEAVWNIIINNLPEYKSYITATINQIDKKLHKILLDASIQDNINYPSVVARLDAAISNQTKS